MSERIISAVSMDTVPVSGLPELHAHLQELVDDAALPLHAKLFDHVQLQLADANTPLLLPTLLPRLTQVLKSTTQDPTPLLSLAIKLLAPLSFTQTLAIADVPSLLMALRSPLPGANLLALAVIHKAARASSDAAILSTLPELVEELVRRWLESPDVGVGERASRVLGDVLDVDCDLVPAEAVNGIRTIGHIDSSEPVKHRVPGRGLLWRLIFLSPSHLSLIQDLCTPGAGTNQPSRSMTAVAISQGRLLRLLPRLATLNIRALHGNFPGLFPLPEAAAQRAGHGLLPWAALAMAAKSDMLMHLSVIDFFEAFVSVMRVSGRARENQTVKNLVKTAIRDDAELETALRSLPDRTVEEEAEGLRLYITEILT